MEKIINTKVGDIVTSDFRTANVFKKAGIDFCCGGHLTLGEACKDKNLDVEQIQDELLKLQQSTNA